MTDPILVLAWLVLAHFAGDFLLQTGGIARAKAGSGSRALAGVIVHGLIVAACLVPVGLAYGGPGWLFLALTAVSHVAIDRAKVLLTRRVAVAALADAHRRHEGPQPADHLGRAWTPRPAALFVADQVFHLIVAVALWAVILVPATLAAGWATAVDGWLGGWDRAVVHDVVAAAVVLAALAIVNIQAAALFVAVLVRPVEQSAGETRWGGRVAPATTPPSPAVVAPAAVRRWSVRIGPLDARVEAEPDAPRTVGGTDSAALAPGPLPPSARVGATIGVLERILIVVFVLTGSEAAIGFVVAAKTLARFRLLDDRDFAEYYLLGTLASVAVAIITALVGRLALNTLLG
ncbi:MAG TPA: DUF3307 domain-containing protein [Candidatus Limnocylindrales bacterium]|nr:DUF3307 domain-containing protein [Candidatus Limnocylindrales bacterium]